MPLSQLRNVNFGRTRANATGSSGVGYTILDQNGATVFARTTAGVYQTAPGIYATYITFPDDFTGQVLWDTGAAFPTASYATEQYNVEENDPRVAETYSLVGAMMSDLVFLRDMTAGRWKIANNKMQFFKEDNITLVAEFDLFDDTGTPAEDSVFERRRV